MLLFQTVRLSCSGKSGFTLFLAKGQMQVDYRYFMVLDSDGCFYPLLYGGYFYELAWLEMFTCLTANMGDDGTHSVEW